MVMEKALRRAVLVSMYMYVPDVLPCWDLDQITNDSTTLHFIEFSPWSFLL